MVLALVSLAWLVLPGLPPGEIVSLSGYRELIRAYRDTGAAESPATLRAIDHVLVYERNDQLLGVVDLSRPGERRELVAATVLMADIALSSPSAARDFFLDEAIRLAAALGEGPGLELQKQLHLAVALTLFREQRIAEAYHVLEPAARQFPEDIEVQYTFGTLSELRGLVEASNEFLQRAEAAYSRALVSDPAHVRARSRLGHVLLRLGQLDRANEQLSASLDRLDDDVHRVVALLSLGDTYARRAEPELELAIDAYRKALAIDPACQAAIVSLSRAFARTGDTELGGESLAQMLSRAAQWDAPDSWMLYRLAESLSASDRWEELRQWRP